MKDAVKKVIAAITVGKDMSALFPDVVNCMRTGKRRAVHAVANPLSSFGALHPLRCPDRPAPDSIEIKKLVYLYLINYAKSNPDLTIMAVNSFVKDSEHPSPLIRALAIRTMGCIRVEKIVEYLTPPLKKALSDEDPYVRKTAALAVAKLYDISPAVVRQQGFIDSLRDQLSDANPTVVANAVAALSEIADASGREGVFEITGGVLQKLLAALNECTEWGQVFILDALARYAPSDTREAENIVERVTPRLVHQNPAVVLSAVKVVIMYLEAITNAETVANFCRRLAPPLVSLAQAAQPEVQYVALRNISLIVQRRPNLLAHKVKVFFCKYNDPIYVKMEKLDILVKLVTDKTVDGVLLELREYASEVDVEYVRRAVRTIGRCAIKLEPAAEKCIKVLLALIQTKVNYVVQEAVVVIKDIFRRYPNRYESIIGVLCSCLEGLDEPEAKASMIWIIGEYADRIDNAAELLASFTDSFHDETTGVQLALLTAAVKLFLKRPTEAEELVQSVLSLATEHSDNPDLRDRGYIYWRLLSTDPDAAKAVALAERPVIQDDTASLEPALLDILLRNLSTLASVYHKPPEAFVRRARPVGATAEGGDDDDLLGLGGAMPSAAAARPAAPAAGGLDDFFGGGGAAASTAGARAPPSYPVLGEKDGLVVRGGLVRRGGAATLELVVESSPPVNAAALKFNVNALGVSPASATVNFSAAAGGATTAAVQLAHNSALAGGDAAASIQAALRDNTTGRVVFFGVPLRYDAFFVEGGGIDRAAFGPAWRDGGAETAEVAREVASTDVETVKARLSAAGLTFVASRPGPDPSLNMVYFSARAWDAATGAPGGVSVLAELTFKSGLNAIKVVVKTAPAGEPYGRLAVAAVKALLA